MANTKENKNHRKLPIKIVLKIYFEGWLEEEHIQLNFL